MWKYVITASITIQHVGVINLNSELFFILNCFSNFSCMSASMLERIWINHSRRCAPEWWTWFSKCSRRFLPSTLLMNLKIRMIEHRTFVSTFDESIMRFKTKRSIELLLRQSIHIFGPICAIACNGCIPLIFFARFLPFTILISFVLTFELYAK